MMMDVFAVMLVFFANWTLAAVFNQQNAGHLSRNDKLRLENTYDSISQKLKSEGFVATKEQLVKHANDLALALNNDLVYDSWIVDYGFSESEHRSELLQLLAKNCIGTSDMRNFRRACLRYEVPALTSTFARVMELYERGFIRVEDLLFIPADLDVTDGVKLVRFALEEGFDVNHVMHFDDIFDFMSMGKGKFRSALGDLVERKKYDLVKYLIEAGADVNLPPSQQYRNLWELVTSDPCLLDASLLGLIASLTDDLFTIQLQDRYAKWMYPEHHEYDVDTPSYLFFKTYQKKLQQVSMIDAVLRNELEKRLQSGRISAASLRSTKVRIPKFSAYLQPSCSELSILDFAGLYQPKPLISTLALVRECGAPCHYPLTVSALTEPVEAFRALVESGTADFNENFFINSSLLESIVRMELYEHLKLLAQKGPDSLFASAPFPGILAFLLEHLRDKPGLTQEYDELLRLVAKREDVSRIRFVLTYSKSYNLNSKQIAMLRKYL